MSESKADFAESSENPQKQEDGLAEISTTKDLEPLPSRAFDPSDSSDLTKVYDLPAVEEDSRYVARFATAETIAEPELSVATENEQADSIPKKQRKKKRKLGILSLIGYGLLLTGLVMLVVLGYDYYRKAADTGRKINEATVEVKKTWDEADGKSSTKDIGTAFALLRIPYLGKDWQMPIVVGVSDEDLYRGVGWFEKTALPGQLGNFAVAGHNGLYGYPFTRLHEVPKGAEVIVETKDYIYTYVLDNSAADKKIKDTEVWVLDKDPINEKNPPDTARITLITCADIYTTPNRLVAFGHLEKTEKKK